MKKIEKGAIKNYCKENKQGIKHVAKELIKVVAEAAVVGFAAYFGSTQACKGMFESLAEQAENCTKILDDFPTEDIIEEMEEVAAV